MRSTPRCGAANRTTPPASSVLFFARTKTDSPVESQNDTSARSKTSRVRPRSSRSLIWSWSWGAVAMSSSPATDTTTTSERCSVCTVRDIQDLQLSRRTVLHAAVVAQRHPRSTGRSNRVANRHDRCLLAAPGVTLSGMVISSEPDLRQRGRVHTELMERIRTGIIGDGQIFPGPYGPRRITYADYTASG